MRHTTTANTKYLWDGPGWKPENTTMEAAYPFSATAGDQGGIDETPAGTRPGVVPELRHRWVG